RRVSTSACFPCTALFRSKIPDGTYEAESFLDNDGRTLDVPIRVKVKVKVEGSQMTVDYSEMHPQVNSPMNSGRSGGIAAARVARSEEHTSELQSREKLVC